MNDPLLMRRLEGLRYLFGDAERLVNGNRATSNSLFQALAVDEFQDEELRAVDFFDVFRAVDLL